MPKRWWIVGSCGIRKTRANLYLSGQIRYVSMSDAESISPRPRRGMNGSSEASAPFFEPAGRSAGSRPLSRSQPSSPDSSKISRCSGVAHWARISLTSRSAVSRVCPSRARSISAATLISSR
jgi:hypothetical protein